MLKNILIAVIMVIVMTLIPSCTKMKGETAGEYLDDSVIR